MVSTKEKHRRNVAANLRQIFNLSFWKRVHREFGDFETGRPRWDLRMCLFAGLLMQIMPGNTERERFTYARAILATLFNKRRRCGETFEGFTSALSVLPLDYLERVRETIQQAAIEAALNPGKLGRWQVFGLDGSKEDIPRTEAHENHYGVVTKAATESGGTAQRLVVAAVDLRYYLAWDWASFSAIGSERDLALEVIRRLEPGVLVVCDAGFIGYEWVRQVIKSGHHFLLRVGSNVKFLSELLPQAEFHEGQVWLWPKNKHNDGPPVILRLIRLQVTCCTDSRKQEEMWLVTDVLDEAALTRDEARCYYGKRWPGNECTFRTWKHTLQAAKLDSRKPETAEREADFSLCALLMLQVSVLCARKEKRIKQRKQRKGKQRAHGKRVNRVSVAQAQRVWRDFLIPLISPRRRGANALAEALGNCIVDNYRRRSKKVRRKWPKRKDHRTPGVPIFRKLDSATKILGYNRLQEQQRAAS